MGKDLKSKLIWAKPLNKEVEIEDFLSEGVNSAYPIPSNFVAECLVEPFSVS